MHGFWSLTSVIQTLLFQKCFFPYTGIMVSPETDTKEQISTLWKQLSSKPSYSSACRLLKQQALNNPHRFTKKQVQRIFCCVFGYCKCCTFFEINLLPQSLKALFLVTSSVKHCELRTPGQRSSKRVCRNDRTPFQAISALLWNLSTQIQFFLGNWYVLVIEKSNLKGQVQRKRNPINRNEFQI